MFNFIKKETSTQVFSCKFCKIFKDTSFNEHLRATASEILGLEWYSRTEPENSINNFSEMTHATKL